MIAFWVGFGALCVLIVGLWSVVLRDQLQERRWRRLVAVTIADVEAFLAASAHLWGLDDVSDG